MTSIALAIPHASWIPERSERMVTLRRVLGVRGREDTRTDVIRPDLPMHIGEVEDRRYGRTSAPYTNLDLGIPFDHVTTYAEFTDREPNQVWSVKMWRWLLDTGAEFCLTLQDDVIPSPKFWPELRAMLAHLPPGSLLGLSGVHPAAVEVARRGHRWYRTTSWVIGWAYGMWREDLAAFLEWRTSDEGDAYAERIKPNGEDAVINAWVGNAKRDTWHPVPAIVDHDTSVGSSYANDDHGHRRPWVTWHTYGHADLTNPDFWIVNGKRPQHLHTVPQHVCWHCGKRKAIRGSQTTGAMICALCAEETVRSCVADYERIVT